MQENAQYSERPAESQDIMNVGSATRGDDVQRGCTQHYRARGNSWDDSPQRTTSSHGMTNHDWADHVIGYLWSYLS
jgi:hypothetical protein